MTEMSDRIHNVVRAWTKYPDDAGISQLTQEILLAIRYPTDEMIKAGDDCDGYTVYDDNACCETHWRAMIHAALTPPTRT